MRRPSALRVAVVLAASLHGLLPANTLAQSTGDSEVLRRRAQEEAEERQRRQRAPDVRLPRPAPLADAEAIDLPAETPCFRIDSLRVDGENLDAFPWIAPYLARYAGRCVGQEGVGLIVKRVSAGLVERGYITTRVGLPEQSLASGVLVLQLVPGIVRQVRFADDTPAGDWRSAFPIRAGDLLNLRDIEQGLEQLKRVPSQDVDFKILPGETPGTSDILITVKRGSPWRVGLSLDDAGAQATGRRQSSLTLSVDNPLGVNDLLSLGLNADAENDRGRRGTRGHSVQYSVPWGHWTVSVSDSLSRYHQRIQGINQTFVSSGESASQEIRIQRLVHRNQTGKTSLQFRASRREQRSYLDDTEIQVQHRTVAAAEWSLAHQQHLGAAQLSLALAHKEGVPWFGGRGDAPGLAPGSPTNRYRMQTLDLGLQAPFRLGDLPLRWLAAFRGQTTNHVLYASEQMAIGGRYTVRGFSGDTTLVAERGHYLRNELEAPLPVAGHAFYVAIDQGRVGGPGAQALAGRGLAGAAIGLRGSLHGLNYDGFIGRALRRPDGFQANGRVTGFQLSYLF